MEVPVRLVMFGLKHSKLPPNSSRITELSSIQPVAVNLYQAKTITKEKHQLYFWKIPLKTEQAIFCGVTHAGRSWDLVHDAAVVCPLPHPVCWGPGEVFRRDRCPGLHICKVKLQRWALTPFFGGFMQIVSRPKWKQDIANMLLANVCFLKVRKLPRIKMVPSHYKDIWTHERYTIFNWAINSTYLQYSTGLRS